MNCGRSPFTHPYCCFLWCCLSFCLCHSLWLLDVGLALCYRIAVALSPFISYPGRSVSFLRSTASRVLTGICNTYSTIARIPTYICTHLSLTSPYMFHLSRIVPTSYSSHPTHSYSHKQHNSHFVCSLYPSRSCCISNYHDSDLKVDLESRFFLISLHRGVLAHSPCMHFRSNYELIQSQHL